MKTNILILTILLPAMASGADLLDRGGTGGGGGRPTVQKSSLSPIMITIERNILNIAFAVDMGDINVKIQDENGLLIINQTINTSIQDQSTYSLSAGIHVLTVTDLEENVISHHTIIIP